MMLYSSHCILSGGWPAVSVSPITGGDNFDRLISVIKCLPDLSFEIDKYVFKGDSWRLCSSSNFHPLI